MSEPSRRFTLRDLPFVARLTLAAFLCSVGIGYLSALVQLHAQQSRPGQALPGEIEVIDSYHGKPGMGVLERLLVADETLPLSSNGSMRSAFTRCSTDWTEAVFEEHAFEQFAESLPKEMKEEEKAEKWEKLPKEEKDKKLMEAKQEIRAEREVEIAGLLAWIHDGLPKESYDQDNYTLPAGKQGQASLTKKFEAVGANEAPAIKIKTLLNARCARCHKEGREAATAPLITYKQVAAYAKKDIGETGGMSLRKLAQSTHVHLLGFSVLYGMTGLIFACSSWPGILRFLIAPLALIAQVVDISFWWLARLHDPYGPQFAKCIIFSGGVAGAALGLQIVLSLFSLFGWFGRFVVLLLLVLAVLGAYYVNDQVVGPYLAQEAKLVSP